MTRVRATKPPVPHQIAPALEWREADVGEWHGWSSCSGICFVPFGPRVLKITDLDKAPSRYWIRTEAGVVRRSGGALLVWVLIVIGDTPCVVVVPLRVGVCGVAVLVLTVPPRGWGWCKDKGFCA